MSSEKYLRNKLSEDTYKSLEKACPFLHTKTTIRGSFKLEPDGWKITPGKLHAFL